VVIQGLLSFAGVPVASRSTAAQTGIIRPMVIRRYEPRDHGEVVRIVAEAFGGRERRDRLPAEVGLVDALIEAGDVLPRLSLVAVADAALVGAVVCSRAAVGSHEVAALGPLAVSARRRRAGVGSALVHAALGAADALDVPLVGLLGAIDYYARFGFVPARTLGIEAPDAAWGDHFQVRTLAAYEPGIAGPFRYAPAFALV
jgi:putative acetyltransferase